MGRILVYLSLFLYFVASFYPKESIDPKLLIYDNLFFQEVAEYCPKDTGYTYFKRTIKFTKLDKTVIGLCSRSNVEMILSLDKETWDTLSETDRRSVYFHESLHCYYHLLDEQNDTTDIMYKEMVSLNKDQVYYSLHKHLTEICNDR